MSEQIRRRPAEIGFGWQTRTESEKPVIVIGAVNMDLSGTPAGDLRPGDSNPGRVTLSTGGVGRNIAENLRRLGRRVSLITITGDDHYGQMIREQCRELGIGMEMSLTDARERTSTYLCVNESNGDLHTAVADMAIYEKLTPDRLRPLLGRISEAALVILDANLPEETITFLAHEVKAPMAADSVSAAKVLRLRNALPRLELIKPNAAEAELLTGTKIRTEKDLRRAAEMLMMCGVKKVFISLGERGVYADDGKTRGTLPCVPGIIRNTTGCGDAFLAAAADAWLEGLDVMECARRALRAAAWCAADERAVSPTLSRAVVEMENNGKID